MKDVFVVEGDAVLNTVTHERYRGLYHSDEFFAVEVARHMNEAYRRGYKAAQKGIRTALGVAE